MQQIISWPILKQFYYKPEKTHRIQIDRDIYSISKELRNVIYKDMEQQAYHI